MRAGRKHAGYKNVIEPELRRWATYLGCVVVVKRCVLLSTTSSHRVLAIHVATTTVAIGIRSTSSDEYGKCRHSDED